MRMEKSLLITDTFYDFRCFTLSDEKYKPMLPNLAGCAEVSKEMMVPSRLDKECSGVCSITKHNKCFPHEFKSSLNFDSEELWEGEKESQNSTMYVRHWGLRDVATTVFSVTLTEC